LFGRLLALYPDDPWLTQDLARVYRATGNFASCRAAYLRLGKVAAQFSAPWFHLSFCSEDPTEQVALLTLMLQAVPDHAGAAERLGALDAAAGRRQRACGCYQRVSEIAAYPLQAKQAIDAARRYECRRVLAQPCPGEDPLKPRAP
jgi:hypothetical protein